MADMRGYDGAADLRDMQRLVQRTWGPTSRVHVGDLVWGRLSIPDSQDQMRTALWRDGAGECVAWAWVELPGDATVLVDPAHAELWPEVMFWAESQVPGLLAVEVMDDDDAQLAALDGRGYRLEQGTPYFTRHDRDLADLPDVELAPGYAIEVVGPADAERRAACHRLGWSDLGSRVSADAYAALMATWPYLQRTDLVVVSPEDEWVASALGWYDDLTGVGLVEPVSCAPEHRGRGLARAVNLALLHGFRILGATSATVLPRGDEAYPVPARLYQSIGYDPGPSTQRLTGPW